MEENTSMESTNANQQDAFLSAWNEPDETELADQQTYAETENGGETPEENGSGDADNTKAENAALESETTGEGANGTEGGENPAQQEAVWNIRHMGEQRQMRAADITPELLQKGLDYDRVRGKYDEAKPVIELLGQFAKDANMSLGDYAKYLREETKKASGMSEADAKRAVELEDREAAVSAFEAQQREAAQEKENASARVKADLAEFSKAFPDIYQQARSDPKVIPDEVWKDVNGGKMSLTAAYSRYAVARANAKAQAAEQSAAAAQQNRKNAARSTGSMQGAGNSTAHKDEFLREFLAD